MLVGASTYNLCLFKQAHWEGAAVCALKKWLGGRKPGLVDSKLDSRFTTVPLKTLSDQRLQLCSNFRILVTETMEELNASQA